MIIENNQSILEVSEKGAEMTSFRCKSDLIERFWQGDSAYWAGRNPLLFPLVGNTYNKISIINGTKYEMGNHGFARTAHFKLDKTSDDTIVCTLFDSEETLRQYPFKFKVEIIYQLIEKRINITVNVHNLNDVMMPFNLGFHPAFNCPLNNETLEDYWLEFDEKETLQGLMGPFSLKEENKIALNEQLFVENPTVCFHSPKSSVVSLKSATTQLRVGVEGYPWLAFWKKPSSPFVCIEPWLGHGDFDEIDRPFEQREGTICLEAKNVFTTSYFIEVVR